MTSNTFRVADEYVDRFIHLDPDSSVAYGLITRTDTITDYSPRGVDARARCDRETLRQLAEIHQDPEDREDRSAAQYLRTRLASAQALHEAGEHLRPLLGRWGPAQLIRQTFDQLPRDTPEDWDLLGARLTAVPAALAGLRESLEEGMAAGVVAARRQAVGTAADCAAWSAQEPGGVFGQLIEGAPTDLGISAADAAHAYEEFGEFLVQTYAPAAREVDSCGEESYAIWAGDYLGGDVDLREAYAWAWDEFHTACEARGAVCALIEPGASPQRAREVLRAQPDGWIDDPDEFCRWVQDLQDSTIEALHGTHFDIPDPVRRIEVRISPEGSAGGVRYTPPSEDFGRPGRIWYPISGRRRRRPLSAMTTAFHEGVPGHHLQNGQVRVQGDRLSRYQRAFYLNVHGEGWALYAEQLMMELGYVEEPEAQLSTVGGQIVRAMRVVLDIGLHLRLRIPATESFQPGAIWDHDSAVEWLSTEMSAQGAAAEVYRYLGAPGQAITYLLGQREWLRARKRAATRQRPFDLSHFHNEALALGPFGINGFDQIDAALTPIEP